ncbi:MAG: ribbon-helix-helix protein, CopG family [Planctomycetes bacterium]|nr:ribbon-helix-helix protein, CopG family [Planctomycetota bacterium]
MGKLTISMDDDIIRAAKQLAAADNVSVSAMFRRYVLCRLKPQKPKIKIGPLTKKATGIIKLDESKSDKELIAEALMEKYSL